MRIKGCMQIFRLWRLRSKISKLLPKVTLTTSIIKDGRCWEPQSTPLTIRKFVTIMHFCSINAMDRIKVCKLPSFALVKPNPRRTSEAPHKDWSRSPWGEANFGSRNCEAVDQSAYAYLLPAGAIVGCTCYDGAYGIRPLSANIYHVCRMAFFQFYAL